MSTTPEAPQPLAPLEFPLSGTRLIEASAGTGKTFTIAILYVRLVLGHGRPALPGSQPAQPDLFEPAGAPASAFARALNPSEILVVTFTDAATQELHERIRSRLTQAAGYFRADPATIAAQPTGQDLLHDLRADYPPHTWPAQAHRLTLAAQSMDEAAVSTIHGWCNRMLHEHAFDSGSLFAQSLEADQRELRAEVVRDYWRSFLAPLDAESAAEILAWKITAPAVLARRLRDLLPHVGLLPNAPPPDTALAAKRAERARHLAALKQPWHDWLSEIHDLLETARARRQFDARSLTQGHTRDWLDAIAKWRDDPDQLAPSLTDKAFHRLSPAGLAEIWRDGSPPVHPGFAALHRLPDEIAALPNAQGDLLRHAAHWFVERLATEQARRAQMGFDDLIKRLQAAVTGPGGTRLAEVIRQQFPVALIDEFQDTDPLQYAIFDAIYRVAENAPDAGLILIGDPKQAIYGFRGADIHTYLAARRATAGRHYTLRRNFRSTHAMVEATNHCFASAESRPGGAGAFLFRQGLHNPIPFVPAESQGRADHLQIDGAAPAALTVWSLPATGAGDAFGKGAYQHAMAEVCASEIVRLLALGQANRAGFAALAATRQAPTGSPAGAPIIALRPADIAVLVDNRDQARVIRQALARRGVRSLYLSDQESVFGSDQAGEMQHWLAACANPDDANRLRAALATETLGLGWQTLDTLNRDEQAWEHRVMQFRGYRDCWRRQGVLPAIRRLLHDFDVPARLLQTQGTAPDAHCGTRPDGLAVAPIRTGERILTDLLHLAELLQQASLLLDGEQALIRHLAEQRETAAEGAVSSGDARQVRLESDADLVQVITVHKAKGLEYPLVFLPFAASFKATKSDASPLIWHENGHRHLSMTPSPALIERVERDRLAEDLRKLYVALTRARHATWIGVAPTKDLDQSAIGYILGASQPIGADTLPQHLRDWRATCAPISVVTAPPITGDTFTQGPASPLASQVRIAQRAVASSWWMASYTALTAGLDSVAMAPETPAEDTFLDDQRTHHLALADAGQVQAATGAQPVCGLLHDFPRGADAGIFLHDLLEWAATQGFARAAGRNSLMRDQIARRCQVRGWTPWIEPLSAWLHEFLTTPLRLPAMGGLLPTRVTLASLERPIAELEFWLTADQVSLAQVDRLVCEATLDAAPRPSLRPRQIDGLLKGFIDLVFEHEGRFYVVDYKSNWLGPDDQHYSQQAQRALILQSRYELQYVLYLFALHRLLASRLPNYDYDRHIGGAVYLFLRGSRAPSQGVHAERPPRALIEALDRLFASDKVEDSP